jgi:FMN-dependent NADH-azoreductase
MTNILLLNSSPRGEASVSGKVALELVAQLKAKYRVAKLVTRDLTIDAPPHLDNSFVTGGGTPEDKRSTAQAAAIDLSDRLIGELKAADIVVIASPMFNFGPTTQLKAWFDYVLRAGVTFKYTEKGPEGLMSGKKVYVVQARGGVYSSGPAKAIDFQEPYLRHLLGFMGITDVNFVAVEGIAFGPEAAEKAVQSALDGIPQLLAAA